MFETQHHGERGQALVEFALTIPIIFLAIFGVIDFGRALYAYDLVTSAARLGSRFAIVHGPACSPAPTCTATPDTVQTYVRSQESGIDASTLNVTTTWPVATGCAGGAPMQKCPVLVTVTYSFKYLLVFSFSTRMTSSSQMVVSR